MSIFNPLNKFLIQPHGQSEYNKEKNGVIVTSSIESHKDVNRIGEVVEVPVGYEGEISKGDLVVIHHNIFRSYYDMKGYERKSREHFKDNLYLVDIYQIYLVKKDSDWFSFDEFCFVAPEKEKEEGVFLGRYNNNIGTIKYANKTLVDMGIKSGDRVGFTDDSEYEFEINDLLLYRMKTKDICIKIN